MPAVDLHPVKHETFDLAARTNTDPKGFVRAVEQYRRTDSGLYMARGADHPRFGYLESWLLPALDLRINRFHFRPGHDTGQDLYIDIAAIEEGRTCWHTRDLYVDLVTFADRVEVRDLDELAAATYHRFIDAEESRRAMAATVRASRDLAAYGGVDPWLRSRGIVLTWAAQVTLHPPGPERRSPKGV